MNEDKHIIWSNYDLDYEDWRGDLEAEYKAYAVSYMLCKRYGIEAKGYDIGRLNSVFKGQDPREDVPAALSDMRETFKSLNGRMARAMGLTRDTKQKEPER